MVLDTEKVFLFNSIVNKVDSSVQIKVSTRHGHLADTTQEKIKEKASKLTHLFDRLTMIEITLDHQRELHLVEFLVQAEHKHDFVAKESHIDLMAAVDLALDKLDIQIRRYKEKLQDHRRDISTGEATKSFNTDSDAK